MKRPKSFAFRTVAFLQGEDAMEALHLYEEESNEAAADYLWEYENVDADYTGHVPWGSTDRTYKVKGGWLSVSRQGLYISLTAPVTRAQCEQSGEITRVEREREHETRY